MLDLGAEGEVSFGVVVDIFPPILDYKYCQTRQFVLLIGPVCSRSKKIITFLHPVDFGPPQWLLRSWEGHQHSVLKAFVPVD